jgi:hypothetical protein
MMKMQWMTEEAQRQGSSVVRVNIDFTNAFNSINQAALWKLMRRMGVPDVDLLESIYAKTTVRVAPNDHESATITFDTGVAQGSVLSPILFIIFINALIRLLTATGKKHNISHGLDRLPQMNNLAFCDDLSLFAQSGAGMQKLMETIEQFEEWSGIGVNLSKTVVTQCHDVGQRS